MEELDHSSFICLVGIPFPANNQGKSSSSPVRSSVVSQRQPTLACFPGFPVGKPNWARASGQYLHVGKLWRAPRKSPSRRPRRPIPRLFRVLHYRLRINLPEPKLPLVPLLSNINCIRYQWQTLYVYLTLLGYGLTLTYRIRAFG